MEMTCVVNSLSSIQGKKPWSQRKNFLILNNIVLSLSTKSKTAVSHLPLRTVVCYWTTSPICMYYLNRGSWVIFVIFTHVWIFTAMLASKALIRLAIFQELVVYGTILMVFLISYTYPIWRISLVSPMIPGSEIYLRCISYLAPFNNILNLPVDYSIWISTTIIMGMPWWLRWLIKYIIVLLQTNIVLNVPEISKIILVDLAWINSSKLLKIICSLTALLVDDIKITEDIWGPNLGYLKVITARQKPIQVWDSSPLITLLIYQKYKQITLCADFMKVSSIFFFISISKHLYFLTIEFF